ncbi:MAG: hypothetical protein GQ574_16245 [Crocinitomix sp.]|nr:hypothetical protein [Crocinitomix sp.]
MKIFFLGLGLFLTLGVFGQYDVDDIRNDTTDKQSNINWFEMKKKIYVGGEANLSFRSGSSFIFFSPQIGYDITERFSAGVTTMYQLLRSNQFNVTYNFSSFGGGVFARYRPIEQIVLQAEFDIYNTVDFLNDPLVDRVNVPAFMAGAGYSSSLGDRATYQIMLMYDFIGDYNMPLSSLVFQQLHLKMGFYWHLG